MSRLKDKLTEDATNLIPMLIATGKCPGHYCNDMPVLETSDVDCDCDGTDEQCKACWLYWMEV